MGTSLDPPGRAAFSDDTEDSSYSSIVTAPDSLFQMMLQFDISPDLLPVPDSAVVPPEGVWSFYIYLLFLVSFYFQSPCVVRTVVRSLSVFIWLDSKPV